jgi:hypothetical protein
MTSSQKGKNWTILLFFAQNVYCNQLKKKLKQKLFKFVLNDVKWKCDNHNLVEEFCEKFVKFYIFTWVNNVNRILSSRDHKNLNDVIKQKAEVKYYKTKGKKCAVKIMKQLH